MTWYGVVWYDMAWCGMVWCGVVWHGVVWCGMAWCGMDVSSHPSPLPTQGGMGDPGPKGVVGLKGEKVNNFKHLFSGNATSYCHYFVYLYCHSTVHV